MISMSLAASAACSSEVDSADDDGEEIVLVEGTCVIEEEKETPSHLNEVQCKADFLALSAEPSDATLPGSRSVKVAIDLQGGDKLYFIDSETYPIHYDFVSKKLSGGDLPIVPALSEFNRTEYYKPDRRFILAAVTFYEDANVWALEISPYDTAPADMVDKLYTSVSSSAYFGPALRFHPTSDSVATVAEEVAGLPIVSTDEIYAGTDFQPLTLGESMGRLYFTSTENLETEYLSYRDIVVLDGVPNDISVVSGLITEQFQTPLSHVNILSQNRGTPNMGLRGATSNEKLRALEGKWIHLVVTANEWTVEEVTREQADEYWEAHRPVPVVLPPLDLTKTGLWEIEDVVVEDDTPLRDLLKEAARGFGGKAAQYSILRKTKNVPIRKAFAVPVYYYDQFMRENGFYDRITTMLADEKFLDDPAVRDQTLKKLRDDMTDAPLNEEFQTLLRDKVEKDYKGLSMRFRTSTNSEDLDGFPCAGCYESHTGDPVDWEDVLNAVRETYSTIWLFRTFEERAYYGIDHTSVGMALLVHHNFPDEEANGVAVTANPYDPAQLEPGFYVNVQSGGDAEIVAPPPGVTSDSFLYFFESPNQPITFLSRSNLVPEGETVLTKRQTYQLGQALFAIHERFSAAYGPAAGNNGWYAMDVEFKFDNEEVGEKEDAVLFIKQARPYPQPGK
jgi:hypothetical protein